MLYTTSFTFSQDSAYRALLLVGEESLFTVPL